MKFTKILLGALATSALASCADLDTEILDGYVSTEQKQEVLDLNPDMASASVMGVFSQFFNIFTISSQHLDFEYPAVMLGMDSMGTDLIGKNSGYNWFASYEGYQGNSPSGWRAAQLWLYQYAKIKTANSLVASIPADTDEAKLKFFRAQGLAARAFEYWTLAQCYQFNYVDHLNSPCVPLITDENELEVAEVGAGRATVAEVYEQIMKDINEAIDLLAASDVKPESIISEKPKRMISLATAYGLRARFNLTMEKWADAASDATQAITIFSGKPYSIKDVSKPGFTSINDDAWMWGIAINETDYGISGGSIVNWPSMACTFCHGYTDQGGAWRWCSKILYDWIPSTDVRKGWFLDANRKSVNLSEEQQEYIDGFVLGAPTYGDDQSKNIMPYTNVKFNSYQGVLGQSLNASDIPMMRVEEMYLIKAEGEAMSGNTTGAKETLNSFVRTYRDPAYSCLSTTAADIQNDVWMQRRVELWGEGLSFFDIMRLKKNIDRRGHKFPRAFVYNIEYNSEGGQVLLFCIPYDEIAANPALNESMNNKTMPTPTVLPD